MGLFSSKKKPEPKKVTFSPKAPVARKPKPGPFRGTITNDRRRTCVRCGGPILVGEYATPTNRGLVCPGCL